MIRTITFVPQVGEIYEGRVVSIFPYGVFVDFFGKSGLLHVSEISHQRVDKVEDYFKVGDPVTIKLVGVDPKTNKLRLSRKAAMQKETKDQPNKED